MIVTNILIPDAKTKLTWESGNIVVVLANSPCSFDHGLTMGHVVALSSDEDKEANTFQHELAHVEQHNALGAWYLPAHMATKIGCYNFEGPVWDCDFFEWGPYSSPPSPFRKDGSNIIVLRIKKD
jgi:hypothetical protein